MEDRLYFIRSLDSGLIKIGHSTNPDKRIKQLRLSTGERLEFVCVGVGGYEHEQILHERFDSDRVRGEWFRPSFDLEVEIDFRNDQMQRAQARWEERRRVVAKDAERTWQEQYADTHPSEAKAAFLDGYTAGCHAGVRHEIASHSPRVVAQIEADADALVSERYRLCVAARGPFLGASHD